LLAKEQLVHIAREWEQRTSWWADQQNVEDCVWPKFAGKPEHFSVPDFTTDGGQGDIPEDARSDSDAALSEGDEYELDDIHVQFLESTEQPEVKKGIAENIIGTEPDTFGCIIA
jgi:hypothetical protein